MVMVVTDEANLDVTDEVNVDGPKVVGKQITPSETYVPVRLQFSDHHSDGHAAEHPISAQQAASTSVADVSEVSEAGEQFIRGVPMQEVLRSGGLALRDDPREFYRSRPVKQLDEFICHTWDTPLFSKFTALTIHSNLQKALLAVSCLFVILMTLDVFGHVPTWPRQRGDIKLECSSWCTCLSFPCFWLVVFFYYDLPCTRGGTVFIDKLCVDQIDADKRERGINAIPHIIERSKALVVVLTSSGLTKVWTMFEIAAFLILHGPKHLRVQPALMSKVCFMSSLFVYCGVLSVFCINTLTSNKLHTWGFLSLMAGTFLPSTFFVVFLMKWGIQIKQLKLQAQKFDLDTAICTVEADRAMLKNMILKIFDRFSPTSNQLESLRNKGRKSNVDPPQTQFQVQVMVADAVRNAVGTCGVPLNMLICMNLGAVAADLDSLSGDLRRVRLDNIPNFMIGQSILRCVADISCYFAFESLLCHLCVIRAPGGRGLSATLKVLSILVAGVLFFPIVAVFTQITANLLLTDELASALVLGGMIVLCLVNFLIVVFFHCPSCNDWINSRSEKLQDVDGIDETEITGSWILRILGSTNTRAK